MITANLKKVAIVTGASSSIGNGIARYLLGKDYRVILIARNIAMLQKTYDEFASIYGEKDVEVLSLDVTEHKSLVSKLSAVLKKEGRVDVLVNSAGYVKRGTSELAHNELIKMIETNLVGVFDIISLVAPVMKRQESGHIINIASQSGVIARKQLGGYAASKFGLMGLNESLYKELAPYGVYVTAICPSLVDTEMTKDVTSIRKDKFIRVDDIVQTVNYLLTLSPNVMVKELVLQCRAKCLVTMDS